MSSLGKLKICPSILAADFTKLGEEIRRVANADYIHIDIMDGHYVPNLSFGYPIAAAAKQAADLPLDVHLMVANPDQYISDLQILKPEYLTVHYEACTHLQRTLSSIREAGMKAGVALNPHTPISGLKYIMDDLDLILIMTVNPGFGSQSFIPKMLDKIKDTREMLGERKIALQVDGGISLDNIAQVVNAGADTIVAGSAIFAAANAADYITKMRKIV